MRRRSTRSTVAISSKGFEHTRHHIVLWQPVHSSSKRRYPALIILEPLVPGTHQFIYVDFLLLYFDGNDDRSSEWMLLRSRILGLLIDFTIEFASNLERYVRRYPDGDAKRYLLKAFAKALVRGVRLPGLTDHGPLVWRGKGKTEAKKLLGALSDCLKWSEGRGHLNGWSDALKSQRFRDPLYGAQSAHQQIKNNVDLLSYIDRVRDKPIESLADDIPAQKPAPKFKAFPEEYVVQMAFSGIGDIVNKGVTALLLMAVIIFFGGKRKSEPLHLWTQDVQFVDGMVWIFFHDPAESKVTDRHNRLRSRADVLGDFGYAPRNVDDGRLHAGWKGMAAGATLQWLPFPDDVKRWISSLFWTYLYKVRPALMKQRRALALPDHPFLLVGDEQSEDVGGPLTKPAFDSAWRSAVRTICQDTGDLRLTYGRDYGTTPHGGRHFYAHSIRNYDEKGTLLQRCLHHLSPFSGLPYGEPTAQEVSDALSGAANRENQARSRTVAEALAAQKERSRARYRRSGP
ncbi:hypothetical protein ACK83U_14030 [Rhizobium sp. WW22]|uniref:hypothetical protein n=1 Tax=Rhizobium sp. WW22 TaxID=3389070 RepID=UPI00399B94D9